MQDNLMDERVLDYGVPPLSHRRLYRRIFKAILFIGLIAAAITLGPTAWKWGQYVYWQERCLNYQAPPNQIIFSTASPPTAGTWSGTTCLPAANFASVGSGGGSGIDIFVHEMRRPDGMRCLVQVEAHPFPGNILDGFDPGLEYYVWTLPTWPVARLVQHGYTFETIFSGTPWQIYAGQLDPNNPSHFTFDCTHYGHRYTCDAWLNNSDQLTVSPSPSSFMPP
jgi:hypothetical protein